MKARVYGSHIYHCTYRLLKI